MVKEDFDYNILSNYALKLPKSFLFWLQIHVGYVSNIVSIIKNLLDLIEGTLEMVLDIDLRFCVAFIYIWVVSKTWIYLYHFMLLLLFSSIRYIER